MQSKLFYILCGACIATLLITAGWFAREESVQLPAQVQMLPSPTEIPQWVAHIETIPGCTVMAQGNRRCDEMASTGSGTTIAHFTVIEQGTSEKKVYSAILTNYHVVEDTVLENGKKQVLVYRGEEDKVIVRGVVIAEDKKRDLALVAVPESWPTATMYFGMVKTGEPSWIAGYPANQAITITTGQISSWREEWEVRQNSSSAFYGNSGGPVFIACDDTFCFVGVLTSVFVQGTYVLPSVEFFKPMGVVAEFLKENHISY